MEDVSDVEMELDKDEETQNTNQSKEDKNVEIEEEVKTILKMYFSFEVDKIFSKKNVEYLMLLFCLID